MDSPFGLTQGPEPGLEAVVKCMVQPVHGAHSGRLPVHEPFWKIIYQCSRYPRAALAKKNEGLNICLPTILDTGIEWGAF